MVEEARERVARGLLAQPALGVEAREREPGLARQRGGDVPLVCAQQPRPVEVQHHEPMRAVGVGHGEEQLGLDVKSGERPRCARRWPGGRAPTGARRSRARPPSARSRTRCRCGTPRRRAVCRRRDDDGRIGLRAPRDPRAVGAEHAPQAAEDRIPQRLGVAGATMPVVTSRAARPNCARASCSRRWIIAVTASASGRAVRSRRSRRRPRNDFSLRPPSTNAPTTTPSGPDRPRASAEA